MKDNFDIVKLLLTNEKINVNTQYFLKNTALLLGTKNEIVEKNKSIKKCKFNQSLEGIKSNNNGLFLTLYIIWRTMN